MWARRPTLKYLQILDENGPAQDRISDFINPTWGAVCFTHANPFVERKKKTQVHEVG